MKSVFGTTVTTIAIAATFVGVPAFADIMNFNATLSAAEEVVFATGSKSKEVIKVSFGSVSKKMIWKGSIADRLDNSTAAECRDSAAVGKIASIEVKAQTYISPFEGSASLNDAQDSDVLTGKMYLRSIPPPIPMANLADSSPRPNNPRGRMAIF